MRNRWSDQECSLFVKSCGQEIAPALAAQIYATRLLGSEPDLALHGGGNTSCKGEARDLLGDTHPALFVKASGCDMARVQVDDFVTLDINLLNRLRNRPAPNDDTMAALFHKAMIVPNNRHPSIETLLHLYLPNALVDHTHPSAVLALTNRDDATQCLREAFGTSVAIIPYATAGFECARAAAEALRAWPASLGLVIRHHGLVTWGATPKEAYDTTIKLVTLAETYNAGKRIRALSVSAGIPSLDEAKCRFAAIAPVLRGCLTPASASADASRKKIICRHLADEKTLTLLAAPEANAIVNSTPLTPDYLIRVRRMPLFIELQESGNPQALREQVTAAITGYCEEYRNYIGRMNPDNVQAIDTSDLLPRVLLIPGVGAVCCGENDVAAAQVTDITAQMLSVKQTIYETGGSYASLPDDHLYDMEFRAYQRSKLKSGDRVASGVALVTGAAGAIGAGLCSALLEAGYHVAVSDLPGKALDNVIKEFSATFDASRILSVPMDVTDPASVGLGFKTIIARYGGLDAVIVNAGIAHVSLLADMDLEAFQRLERVNIDGTLLTIREAAKLFALQNLGGDIVLVSTKNVFAPGASFGAYSATKAAAHQLARIASLELADIGVRVNMVAPDAVFSHGSHKSGLWATVGPGRMKARGLDEAGLEEYYRKRNLLKAKVTAQHVASAVLFFLSGKTPTTGATIPVDGGLPDATPR
jgi:rhamnose utilization protein RhaD (predicted bifunctional aldolase and dehydrogenase)/NAD(P)-dependent dehydrogenase (short-subunit alcohol dehydrogenase family)